MDKTILNLSYNDFLNIIHPEDRNLVNDSYIGLINEKVAYETIFRVIPKDGRVVWLMQRAKLFCNKDGKPIKTVGIIHDITNIKAIEEQLRIETDKANKLRIIAENSNKAKSDFLATISHEIRTPMNAILGFGKLILKTELNEIQENYIKKIVTSANSLLGIISNLLEISKIDSNNYKVENSSFNLNEVIDLIIDVASYPAVEKNLDLIKNVEKNVPVDLIGDRTILQHILTNIMGNAVKFTSRGRVKIDVSLIEDNSEMCKIMFTIIDTGIGIPPTELERIFEPFTQAEVSISSLYGGTGLGLTISKRMTELLGGNIYVESIKDKSSSFYIILPFKKQLSAIENLAKENYISKNPNKISILIVEDNKINQELMTSILESSGIESEIAENGLQALEKLKTKTFDLILMDISMPIMDGYKATEEIRKEYSSMTLPIIAMSANVFESDIKKCLNAGMNDHIGKPIDVDELLNKVYKWTNPKEDFLINNSICNNSIIEIDTTLNRLGGNLSLYKRLLKDFFETNKDIVSNLRELHSQNNIDDMIFRIHSIKGTSGNLGLTNIYRTSSEFETELKENKLDNVASFLEILEDEIKDSLCCLESIKNEIESKKELGLIELSEYLSQLEEYLNDYDVRAIDLINTIHINTVYVELNHKLKILVKLINKFKFEESIAIVKEMDNILRRIINDGG